MEPAGVPPPDRPAAGSPGSTRARLARLFDFGGLVVRRYVTQDMAVYAAALAYRGLLALVPFALLSLSLIGLFGIEARSGRR